MRGGQPSTTQPMAGPWLSPQVVTRNRWPKLLCDIVSDQMPVVGNRNVQKALLAVIKAGDVATACGIFHQDDFTGIEAADLAIAGFVLDPAVERYRELPLGRGVPIGHAQFGRCGEQLYGIGADKTRNLERRQSGKQVEAGQRRVAIGEMRFAFLVCIDPRDLHQPPSSSSSVSGQVGDTGCGGWPSILAGNARTASA